MQRAKGPRRDWSRRLRPLSFPSFTFAGNKALRRKGKFVDTIKRVGPIPTTESYPRPFTRSISLLSKAAPIALRKRSASF